MTLTWKGQKPGPDSESDWRIRSFFTRLRNESWNKPRRASSGGESLFNSQHRTVNLGRLERAHNEGTTGPKRLDDTRCTTFQPGTNSVKEDLEALEAHEIPLERRSGDTTPCKVTPVILHGVVSPLTLHTGLYGRRGNNLKVFKTFARKMAQAKARFWPWLSYLCPGCSGLDLEALEAHDLFLERLFRDQPVHLRSHSCENHSLQMLP
jgi:hypothetical protein